MRCLKEPDIGEKREPVRVHVRGPLRCSPHDSSITLLSTVADTLDQRLLYLKTFLRSWLSC